MRTHAEQSFGILVARFGIIWRPIFFSVERGPRNVSACMKFHNFCIEEGCAALETNLRKSKFISCEFARKTWLEAESEVRVV